MSTKFVSHTDRHNNLRQIGIRKLLRSNSNLLVKIKEIKNYICGILIHKGSGATPKMPSFLEVMYKFAKYPLVYTHSRTHSLSYTKTHTHTQKHSFVEGSTYVMRILFI